MKVDIEHGPGNAAAKAVLEPGESCTAEAGAMIAMSGDLNVSTTTHKRESGGLLKAAKRLLAGESFFLNHFTASAEDGELWLATTLPGDMMTYDLDDETLVVQAGSYVASTEGIEVDVGWQGFKSMFSGESLFWLKLNGSGTVVLSSFGAIYPLEVDGELIVDTGHIVAFNESMDFSLSKAGKSWMSSILGGEGLVCKFQGTGTVWAQSHHPAGFGTTLGPMLHPR